MKKITVALLSILLVLSVGQAALAKGSVGVFAGYAFMGGNGFNVSVSGDYEFNNWFSLAGEIGSTLVFYKGLDISLVTANLAPKFDVYQTSNFTLGLKAVVKYVLFMQRDEANQNMFFAGPGLYLNWDISDKFDVNFDLWIPILMMVEENTNANFIPRAKLGAGYKINSAIKLGIEAEFDVLDITAGLKFKYSF